MLIRLNIHEYFPCLCFTFNFLRLLNINYLFKYFHFLIFIWLYQVLAAACGIQFPDQGMNVGPLHWEHAVLATGAPRKCLKCF